MRLLERGDEAEVFAQVLRRASEREGRVVLIHGPAGIGKTSLALSFAAVATAADATVRVGRCDDLHAPRAFAPFRDIAHGHSRLARAFDDGADVAEVLDAILEELDDPLHPVVLVLDDLQWADDATLDAVLVVARRIGRLPAVLVATFRDTDVGPAQRLRRVLGALASEPVTRLPVAPLSRDAVGELVGRSSDDVGELYRVTGGNPFFVLEVAAAAGPAVPISVRDAVLTRVLALPERTQRALEMLSVIPSRVERWLVERVVDGGARALDEAEREGLVLADAHRVWFAHEIVRRAVEAGLTSGARIALNAEVAAVLSERGDASRILHHAVESGDGDLVLRHGKVAAREASRLGSHRQALEAYGALHRFADRLPAPERAALALEYAYELQLGSHHRRAVEVARSAVDLLEAQGATATPQLADALLVLSRAVYWHRGQAAALPHAERAVALLDGTEPSPVTAMAFAHMSRIHLLANRNDQAHDWAERALATAARVGHLPAEAGARINHGAARLNLGEPGGLDEVEQGLDLAWRHGFHESVLRGYFQLAVEHMRRGRLQVASQVLDEGRTYAVEQQLADGAFRLEGLRGCIALNQGALDEARAILSDALDGEVEPGIAGVQPRAWLAQALARLGDAEAQHWADEAWSLAEDSHEAPRVGAAAVAQIELAWLTGRAERAEAVAAHALALADETRHPWYGGDLRVALSRAGVPAPEPPPTLPLLDAHAAALRGDHAASAAAWSALGYPFEQAVELTYCDTRSAMLDGVRRLDELGAVAVANVARALLRSRGVTAVPRGPTRGTRRNPAGLTNRQVDVLALVAEGLTNAAIAERLVLSVRTVDHHVSAILEKLGVTSRQEAAQRADDLGVGA